MVSKQQHHDGRLSSSSLMLEVIPTQLNPSKTRMCGRWRGEEGHGVGNVLDSGYGVDNALD